MLCVSGLSDEESLALLLTCTVDTDFLPTTNLFVQVLRRYVLHMVDLTGVDVAIVGRNSVVVLEGRSGKRVALRDSQHVV